MLHTLRVVLALGPLVVSVFRDRRRWLWWGAPLPRSAAFHARRARRLRRRVTGLGPTFVKLAQVFASRADVIPEPYLSELGTLVDAVPPVPWTAIEAELRAQYGAAPSEVFEQIDPVPLAAASLGQVHRARVDGREVVVKVLRPGVEQVVARDLVAARRILAWCVRRWPHPHVTGLRDIVEEFAARVGEELDFRLEAERADEVRRNFAEDARVRVPRVEHALTRQRALVLEYVPGTRIDRLTPPVDSERIVATLVAIYVQMTLVDGLFHADPHPGNLLVDAEGRVVLLDFGMVIRVPAPLRLAMVRTVLAALRRDADAVAAGFHALDLVLPGADPAEIRRLCALLLELAYGRSTSLDRAQLILSDRVMRTLFDFPIRLPRELVYFARTAALIEGLGTRYDPYFQAIPVASPVVLAMRTRILRALGERPQWSVEEVATVAGFAARRLVDGLRGALRGPGRAAPPRGVAPRGPQETSATTAPLRKVPSVPA
jgi:predicted unusual protein kinase regulating ubiquinone biosynthesis (AarF/ABC1/UbiB family)